MEKKVNINVSKNPQVVAEDVYLILPGCDDSNRGDQALIWETVKVAKDAGFLGKYYMIASENCSNQSKKEGIGQKDYILVHPSENSKDKNNLEYGVKLKIKWIKASLLNLIVSLLLLNKFIRRFSIIFLSDKKRSTLKTFSKAKAAFVKGGGFLHAYGGIIDSYKVFFLLYHINLAHSFGIPVYVMPNSFGPFKGVFVRSMIRYTLKRCRFVSARESISSFQLEKECYVKSYVTNDLAVYLKKDEEFDARNKLIEHEIPINNKKCVAITVRPYRFPGKKNSDVLYRKYKESVRELTKWLSEKGYHTVFVEHVYSENFHEQDMICIQEIIKELPKNVNYSVFSDLALNCRQMKSIYGCFEYMVGTRFHSVIFSMTEGIPSLAITYGGNKGQGIMRDMGLSEYSINMSQITPNILINMFEKLIENSEEVKVKLGQMNCQVTAAREKLIKKIRR